MSTFNIKQLSKESVGIANDLNDEIKSFKAALFKLDASRFKMDIPSNDAISHRAAAMKAFGQIFYEDDQEPNESVALPGVIGVPGEIIHKAKALNEMKAVFKAHFNKLALHEVKYENERMTLARRVLKGTEYERLHNLQASRQVHYVEELPSAVRLTLAKAANPTRIDNQKARRLVVQHFEPQPDEMRRALNHLGEIPGDELLVWARKVKPRPRLNVTLQSGEQVMMNGVLPLLYLIEHYCEESVPIITLSGGVKPNRRARQRVKLQEPALIQSPQLTIFRYRPEYRAG